MGLQVTIGFNGNCWKALEFYRSIFDVPVPQVTTYGDMPPDPDYPMPDEVREMIMHSCIDILGTSVMLYDCTPDMGFDQGKNVGLAVVIKDAAEIKRLYDALKADGEIDMPLEKTDWSDLYGKLTDKFGIGWELILD